MVSGGKRELGTGVFLWIGLSLGIAYWFIEALLHALVFGRATLSEALWPEAHEFWMRSLVVGLLIISGAIAQFLTDRALRAESDKLQSASQRKQAEHETEALLTGTRAVLDSHDPRRSIRDIFESCRSVLGARHACVGLFEPFGQVTRDVFMDTSKPGWLENAERSRGLRRLMQEAAADGKVVRLNDFSGDRLTAGMPAEHLLVQNALLVPVIIEDRQACLMAFGNKPGGFVERDSQVAAAFGELVSICLRNVMALEALRKSESQLKAFNDAVGRILDVVVLDRNLEVVEMNDQARTKLPDLLGKKCYQILREQNSVCSDCPVELVFRDGQIHSYLAAWIGSDKNTIHLSVFVVPLLEPDGRFQRVMLIGEDVTDFKRAEEAREKAEKTLEAQRALAIASDRLRSLGEMAAGIAHELNQPLVGVRGLAEHMLLSFDRDWNMSHERMKEKIGKIIEQADRMTHIIEHVRMFAREADKHETRSVDVNQVVRSSTSLIGAQLRQRGIQIELDLSEIPRVRLNPFSLEEVLLNLLTNSRDAIEERFGGDELQETSISVRTRRDSESPHTGIVLEIVDNGAGISRDDLPRVFDPFFTTKDPDKGTGLGLSISKSIVERYGGSLRIESRSLEGTTVAIRLPAEAEKNPGRDP